MNDPAFLNDRKLWELELKRKARLNRIEHKTIELVSSEADVMELMYSEHIFEKLRPYLKIHDHSEPRMKELLVRLWAENKMSQFEFEELEALVLDGLLLRNIGRQIFIGAEKVAESLVR